MLDFFKKFQMYSDVSRKNYNEDNMGSEGEKKQKDSWIRENLWRLIWWISAPIIWGVGIIYFNSVEKVNVINECLSYWGFIITLFAMMVTVCEVLHSMARTKKISEEINVRTLQIEQSANALITEKEIMSISECSVMVDNVINLINESRFDVAILLIHEIRKVLCKTKRKEVLQKKIKDSLSQNNVEYDFCDMEKKIEGYRTSCQGAGRVNKDQKTSAKQFFVEFRNVLDGLK